MATLESTNVHRKGESVQVQIISRDANDQIQSVTTHTLYGFDNPQNDAVIQAMVDALQEVMKKFSAEKNTL